MSACKISVIIPTRNRPQRLNKTIEGLLSQDLARSCYEILVVDDGSTPPVSLNTNGQLQACTLIRLEGVERSAARNKGAAVAVGEVLLFLDDDMAVGADFLSAHLRAHEEWPGALIVGGVRLPDEALATPFGRFRDRLEQRDTPQVPGPSGDSNFCTAANMSIDRNVFEELGGFDIGMSSSEDQDFALRHTARGGEMVFLPAAEAIHWDRSLDIRSYCSRAEWGSSNMIAFCERYPNLPDNVERHRVNGRLHISREPVSQSARKLIKQTIATAPVVEVLFAIASLLERIAPNGRALDRVYRLLLGAHILRGYRNGRLSTFGEKKTDATRQRNTFAGWALIAIAALATIWITLPTRDTVYRMDDWDYIAELNSLSFSDYAFKVNPDGQFDPLSKLVYAVFLRAFNYSNLPLALFNFVIGWSSVLIWFAILKKLKCWTVAGALAILAIRISFVGIVDVFWFPLQGANEIALLLFSLSLYFLLDRASTLSVWACGAALLGGSLAFGNGVIPPFTLAAAFLLTGFPDSWSKDKRVVAMLLLSIALVVICDAVPRIVQGRGLAYSFNLAGISTYFFWGGVINGAINGVAPLLIPGPVHALFFLLLLAGTVWVAKSNESRERKIVVLALFLTQIATSLLIAATRWERGVAHASSYRYVYMNVFLQLPLMAVLIGIATERLRRADHVHDRYALRVLRWALPAVAVLPLVLGLSCSFKARSLIFSLERGRAQCLSVIVSGDSSAQCISSIYYRADPEYVRRVWDLVNQRRGELRGGSDSLLPIWK